MNATASGTQGVRLTRTGEHAHAFRLIDAEVEAAMAALFTDTRNAAEGAGAAGLAALLREREANRGRTVGFVLTGANVDTARFADVLCRHAGAV